MRNGYDRGGSPAAGRCLADDPCRSSGGAAETTPMESLASDRLLTTAEAAQWLRCSPEHVLRLLVSGRLRGNPIGMGSRRRRWRIYESELRRYVDAAGQAAPAILAVLPTPPARKPAAYKPKILV